ncbi:putative small nuclear ribonucleoprotein G [Sarracenia purpurea var. burkii]
MVVGTLRGFDQFMNLVVDNTVEVNGNEKTDIGMVVIRGNSVVTVEALEPVSIGGCPGKLLFLVYETNMMAG